MKRFFTLLLLLLLTPLLLATEPPKQDSPVTHSAPTTAQDKSWEIDIPKEKIPLVTPKEIVEKHIRWEPLLILDVRDVTAYNDEHIPTALSFPYARMIQNWEELPKNVDIVLYCGGLGCPLSMHAAQLLIWHGYTHVKELDDGINAWKKTGYPTEKTVLHSHPTP